MYFRSLGIAVIVCWPAYWSLHQLFQHMNISLDICSNRMFNALLQLLWTTHRMSLYCNRIMRYEGNLQLDYWHECYSSRAYVHRGFHLPITLMKSLCKMACLISGLAFILWQIWQSSVSSVQELECRLSLYFAPVNTAFDQAHPSCMHCLELS